MASIVEDSRKESSTALATFNGKMEAGLKESSMRKRCRGAAHISGLTAQYMRVSGCREKCMVRVALNSSMVGSTRGPMNTIKNKVMVSTFGAMAEAIWANGSMANNMESGCL